MAVGDRVQRQAGKKRSITIYLTPEQSDALEALREQTRVRQSEYIREGVDMVLAKYAAKVRVTQEKPVGD